MSQSLACAICSTSVKLPDFSWNNRRYLYACKKCRRKTLIFIGDLPGTEPQETATLGAPAVTIAPYLEDPMGAPLKPAPSPPELAPLPVFELSKTEETLTRENAADLRGFLAVEIGEKAAPLGSTTNAPPEAMKKWQEFLRREFLSEMQLPEMPEKKPESKGADPAPAAPGGLKLRPGAAWLRARRHLTAALEVLTRLLLAVAQAIADILLARPFDLLADLHFAFGREWARLWKRLSWLATPLTLVALYVFLAPTLDPAGRATLAQIVLCAAVLSVVMALLLGIPWVNGAFRGTASRGLLVAGLLVVVPVQTYLAVRYCPRWLAARPGILMAAQARLPLQTWGEKFAAYSAQWSWMERRPVLFEPRHVYSTSTVDAPRQSEVPTLDEKARAITQSYLRADLPDLAKSDLIHLASKVLVEKGGPKAFIGTPEEVALRLLSVMTEEFGYFLKPEAIRNVSQPQEPVEVTSEIPSKDLLVDTQLRNTLTTLTYGVKWRGLERIHEILPSRTKARVTQADLARFYAPLFSTGEIFSTESSIVAGTTTALIVKIEYLVVPYIKINPDQMVFEAGIYADLKRQNPVKLATVHYLFIEESDGWKAVQFTSETKPVMLALYPDLTPPGEPQPMTITTRPDQPAPANLVSPEVQ